MIGTAAGLPYVQFLLISAPYAVISLVIALLVLRFMFRHQLPWRQSPAQGEALRQEIAEFDPWALVESRRKLIRGTVILGLTVIGFAAARPLGVGLDFIAMCGGAAALLFVGDDTENAIAKVNWTVILFFTGLFVIVACVEATGALQTLADFVISLARGNRTYLIPGLLAFSALASGLVDNIPVAATLIPMVRHMGQPAEPLWWSIVLGCNLGGNATPTGSISCVIALHALRSEADIRVGWGEFLKIGCVIVLLQVAGGIAYLLLLHEFQLLPSM